MATMATDTPKSFRTAHLIPDKMAPVGGQGGDSGYLATDAPPSVESPDTRRPAVPSRQRHVTLAATAYPGERDSGDIEEGRRILADARAAGIEIALSMHGIALTYPSAGNGAAPDIIDRIRAARAAVVRALGA